MDSVPFTLFFVVCLTSLHGNLARPNVVWPVECAGRNYCFEIPKDYPSSDLINYLIINSDLDLSEYKHPSPGNRDGEAPPEVAECRHLKMKERVYMMKDSNDDIRYVIQLPGTFDVLTPIIECQETILEDDADKYTCVQSPLYIKLPVLSLDESRIELVGVKGGLPSSCSPRLLTSSESN